MSVNGVNESEMWHETVSIETELFTVQSKQLPTPGEGREGASENNISKKSV